MSYIRFFIVFIVSFLVISPVMASNTLLNERGQPITESTSINFNGSGVNIDFGQPGYPDSLYTWFTSIGDGFIDYQGEVPVASSTILSLTMWSINLDDTHPLTDSVFLNCDDQNIIISLGNSDIPFSYTNNGQEHCNTLALASDGDLAGQLFIGYVQYLPYDTRSGNDKNMSIDTITLNGQNIFIPFLDFLMVMIVFIFAVLLLWFLYYTIYKKHKIR